MSAPPPRSPSPAAASRRTTEVLIALTRRAEDALDDVAAAHHAFTAERTQRRHGALALAAANAQQLLRALEAVREQRERERGRHPAHPPPPPHQQQQPYPSRPASPAVQSTAPTQEELQLYIRAEKLRLNLRRVLPRAVAAVEDADVVTGGTAAADGVSSASSRSAASTAAALRSLLHTRSMLSVELKKMDAAVQGIAGSSESLAALHQSLQDVHTTMETAQRMVRRLLTVQSRDDLLLRVSAALFVLVVLYVVAQRVFRFFPATVYVRVDDVVR